MLISSLFLLVTLCREQEKSATELHLIIVFWLDDDVTKKSEHEKMYKYFELSQKIEYKFIFKKNSRKKSN